MMIGLNDCCAFKPNSQANFDKFNTHQTHRQMRPDEMDDRDLYNYLCTLYFKSRNSLRPGEYSLVFFMLQSYKVSY